METQATTSPTATIASAAAKPQGLFRGFVKGFQVNEEVSSKTEVIYTIIWAGFFLGLWYGLPGVTIIPKPHEIGHAWLDMWSYDGLINEIGTSFLLFLESTVIAVAISLVMAYGWRIAFFRTPIKILSKMRYWSLFGLTIIFTLMMSGSHGFKISLMVFGLSTFFVTGMAQVVASVPPKHLDHARSLRMNEWEVLWHVIILGKLEAMIEVIRQNSAIGWMMLSMVEGYAMGEGGLGTMLIKQYRMGKLSYIYGVQLTIFGVAIVQDWLLKRFRMNVCPHVKYEEEGR